MNSTIQLRKQKLMGREEGKKEHVLWMERVLTVAARSVTKLWWLFKIA